MKSVQSALKVCIAPCVSSLGFSMMLDGSGPDPPPSRGGIARLPQKLQTDALR